MVHQVLTYPNKMLKKKSVEVALFDDELGVLLDDMYETMLSAGGVGLAAIQIGVPQAVLLVNLLDDDGMQSKENLLEIINPVITQKSGEIVWQEGCLSIPEYYDDVIRADQITLSYQDRFGNACTLEAEGFLAVAIQHEMDHLDGRLFVERLSILKRKKFEKEWKKQKRKVS